MIEVKFQIQSGLPASQAISRCVIAETNEVIAEFSAGELSLDPMYPKKHYNTLLKSHGWQVAKLSSDQVFLKQI
jgi:hypothetical protein